MKTSRGKFLKAYTEKGIIGKKKIVNDLRNLFIF